MKLVQVQLEAGVLVQAAYSNGHGAGNTELELKSKAQRLNTLAKSLMCLINGLQCLLRASVCQLIDANVYLVATAQIPMLLQPNGMIGVQPCSCRFS